MTRSSQRSPARDYEDDRGRDRSTDATYREWLADRDDPRPMRARAEPPREQPREERFDDEERARDYRRTQESREDHAESRRMRWPDRDARDDFAESRRPSRGSERPRTPPRNDEDPAVKIVESAIRKFEDRAERVERRTVDALESVASWLHRAEEVRADDGEAIDAIFDRLDMIGGKLAAAAAPQPAPLPPAAPAIDFDRRMGDLAARVAGIGAPRPRREPMPAPESPPRSVRQAAAVQPRPAAAVAPSPVADFAPPSTSASTDALRAELRRAAERLAAMRRQPAPYAAGEAEEAPPPRRAAPAPSANVPMPSNEEIAALRADVAAMSRSVANLAPRNAVVALEGALRDLSGRVSALADPEARASLMAPFSAAIGELRDAVRAQNVHGVAEALDRDIRALAKKVDTLAASAVDREAFEGIRWQIEETKALLNGALAKIAPHERIESQIGALADRVESLAANPQPAAEARQVLAALADLRASVERGASTKALASIETRIETLTQRIDSALTQPKAAPVIDMSIVDGLAERLEAMRQSIEARAPAVDGAKLESALRDLSDKLDQRTGRSLDIKPLEAALSNLSQRPIHIDSSPLGDAIRDLTAKLEARPQGDFSALESAMQEMNRRLAAIETKPAPPAPFNVVQRPGPDEVAKLAAEIRAISAKLDERPQGDFSALETAMGEVNRRLGAIDTKPIVAAISHLGQRPAPAEVGRLADEMRTINSKLDEKLSQPPQGDFGALEAVVREMNARLETMAARPAMAPVADLGQRAASPEFGQLAEEIRNIHAKLDERAAAGAGSVEPMLRAIDARLGALDTHADTTQALADAVARIGERIDAVPSSSDLSALERLVQQLGEKIDGQATIALDIHEMQRRQSETAAPDPHAATVAALDEVWTRIDERLSAQAQPPTLGREISGLHDRLDAIDATLRPRAQFEHVLHELTAQGEDTRQALQILLARDAEAPAFDRKLAELGAQHAQADRATQDRLQRVSEALLKLIDRIDRLEDEPHAPDAAPTAPQAAGWTGGTEPAFEPPAPPAPAPEEKPTAALRRQSPPAREAASPLLTLPVTAIAAERGLGRSTLPDHIAAARRAAQAAMAETAADKTAAKAAVAQAAKASRTGASEPSVDPFEVAKQFFAERRRPLLLGLGLVALLTMVAFVGLRSRLNGPDKPEAAPKPAVVGKLSTSIPSAVPSFAPTPDAPKASHLEVYNSAPTGSIPPQSPAIVATIPAGTAQPLRDALIKGDPLAEYEFATRYLDGRGVARDLTLGAKWLAESSAQGLPPAQYRLGALYEKGLGVFKDLNLAKTLYLKAANAGNARAMHNLGVLSAESSGDSKPNFTDAVSWFKKAAKLGVRDSQFNLGILETRGLGLPQDLGQAWLYFSLAAKQNDPDAAKKRDEIAAKLDPAGLQAAQQALASYQLETPSPAANDVPPPPASWGSSAPTAAAPTPTPAPSTPAKIGA